VAIFGRHGQSLANLLKILAGRQIDASLSDHGRMQAFEAGISTAKVLRSLHLKGDEPEVLWIRSRLRRTQETMDIMCGAMGLSSDRVSLLTSTLGDEGDFGTMTGRPRKVAEAQAGLFNSLDEAWPGAESNVELGARVMQLVEAALSVPWFCQTAIGPCAVRIFVLHEGCNRLAIESLLNGRLTLEGLGRPIPNGAPVVLWDEGAGFIEIPVLSA